MVAVITGGEPLLHPERAKHIIEALWPEKAIVLDTSGVGDIRSLLPTLVKVNAHVRVSLDFLGGDNDKERPSASKSSGGSKSSLQGAVQTLDACIDAMVNVSVQTVITTHNDNVKRWMDLRDWLVRKGVRHWVLHVAVRGGAARRWENGKGRRRTLIPGERIYRELKKLRDNTVEHRIPIDIRLTDTAVASNSVLLIDSTGRLYTEGLAHDGKVLLHGGMRQGWKANAIRQYLDRSGHTRRYVNWNPWFYKGTSLEDLCYEIATDWEEGELAKSLQRFGFREK